MGFEQWAIIIGVLTSFVLTVGPWMFMVHAKLAVLASECKFLCDQLKRAANLYEQLMALNSQHEARLQAQAVEIRQIHEWIRTMSEEE
ncbi:MAG: hypothetical protein PVH19_04485 [Planctomycetia bacterium]|jgi:hypothetical protein